jgi:hypothetical protein
MIGPDLVGATKRKPRTWQFRFIQHPEKIVFKDPYAIRLQRKFNGAMMSVPPLTDQQVNDVLDYIENETAHFIKPGTAAD